MTGPPSPIPTARETDPALAEHRRLTHYLHSASCGQVAHVIKGSHFGLGLLLEVQLLTLNLDISATWNKAANRSLRAAGYTCKHSQEPRQGRPQAALVPSKNKENKQHQGGSEDKRGSDNTSLGGTLQVQPALAPASLGLTDS